MAASPGPNVLVNLASNEYFGVVRPERLDGRIVSPTFLDARGDGDHKIVSFFAKRARGAMAGWIIRERITAAKHLVEFSGEGYRYDASRSKRDQPARPPNCGKTSLGASTGCMIAPSSITP